MGPSVNPSSLGAQESPSLSAVMSYLEGNSTWDDNAGLCWFKAASWVDKNGLPTPGTEASVLLAYCFDALKKMYKTTSALIEDSKLREKEQEENLIKLLGEVRALYFSTLLPTMSCPCPYTLIIFWLFMVVCSGGCQGEQSGIGENGYGQLRPHETFGLLQFCGIASCSDF